MIKKLLSLFTIPTMTAIPTISNIQSSSLITPYSTLYSIEMKSDLTIEKSWSGGEESRSETNDIENYEKQFNITYNQL